MSIFGAASAAGLGAGVAALRMNTYVPPNARTAIAPTIISFRFMRSRPFAR